MKSPWCIPIVALFRARTLSTTYISELLSYYLALLYRSSTSFALPVFPSFFFCFLARRNKKNEEKVKEGKEEREQMPVGGERGEGCAQQCPRRCILARLTDVLAEGAP